MSSLTESELLFEEACTGLGLPYSRVPEDMTQTPDYRIEVSSHLVFAEVTQLDENEEDKRAVREARLHGSSSSFPQSDQRIRRKIHKANSQLKQLTEDRHPGVLVLFPNTAIGSYDPQDMHDAMFGSETITFASSERGQPLTYVGASLARDGQMKPERHTSTSAVVSLRRHFDGEGLTMTFYHNKYAKVPFDPDWLRADSVWHYASQEREGVAIPAWVEI